MSDSAPTKFVNDGSGISAGVGTVIFIAGALLGAFLSIWYLRSRASNDTYGAPVVPLTASATADNTSDDRVAHRAVASSVVTLPGECTGGVATL